MSKFSKKFLVLLALLTMVTALYFLMKDKEPSHTGGDLPEGIPQAYYTETAAMARLNEELPISTDNLTITFDYRQGKYLVVSKQGIDVQSEFEQWHSKAPYNNIPIQRFLIK